jgi:integrase/recombinase XerD
VRSARRINAVLAAVRGMIVHAVAEGGAPGRLVQVLYEVADDRGLPAAAREKRPGRCWPMRARHRLHEPVSRVDRADDSDVVAVLGACDSARDRHVGQPRAQRLRAYLATLTGAQRGVSEHPAAIPAVPSAA